jgi:hypothetical protein
LHLQSLAAGSIDTDPDAAVTSAPGAAKDTGNARANSPTHCSDNTHTPSCTPDIRTCAQLAVLLLRRLLPPTPEEEELEEEEEEARSHEMYF